MAASPDGDKLVQMDRLLVAMEVDAAATTATVRPSPRGPPAARSSSTSAARDRLDSLLLDDGGWDDLLDGGDASLLVDGARWYYVQALGNSQHKPVNGPTHFVSSKPYKPAPAASFCRTLPIPHPCDSPHVHSHSDGSDGGLNLHGGDGGAGGLVNPVKRQARPQRPDPRAQLARLVGDVNPAAMRLELETSGKVATGAAPTAAKKKVPVPGAKRDKRAASTANKKAPVTIDKRAKGLASTSKKMEYTDEDDASSDEDDTSSDGYYSFFYEEDNVHFRLDIAKNDVLDFVNDSMKKIEKYVHKRFNQTYNEIMGDLEHDEVLEQEGGCSHRVNCKSEMQV
ncbi:unnamed protein product [Miscanthus lutarioriparius]|uniref:Uncharacterized protein n=1 Tax=Miscanthus lutarioriparius TaxID=422564 RepID=A0A811NKT7_9POAL|nr:unnamed protein product [Miscanthus lutarioriparius]